MLCEFLDVSSSSYPDRGNSASELNQCPLMWMVPLWLPGSVQDRNHVRTHAAVYEFMRFYEYEIPISSGTIKFIES